MSNKNIVYIALFAALNAALGLFPPIPLVGTGVPITAQSMAPMLAGSILGAKRGFLSQLLFLILVAIGLPLLAGGRGGFGVFLGPTTGYLIGWVVISFVIGYLTERFWHNLKFWHLIVINCLAGIVILYAIGIIYLMAYAHLQFIPTLLTNLPYIPGDIIKAVLAAFIAITVKRTYPIIQR